MAPQVLWRPPGGRLDVNPMSESVPWRNRQCNKYTHFMCQAREASNISVQAHIETARLLRRKQNFMCENLDMHHLAKSLSLTILLLFALIMGLLWEAEVGLVWQLGDLISERCYDWSPFKSWPLTQRDKSIRTDQAWDRQEVSSWCVHSQHVSAWNRCRHRNSWTSLTNCDRPPDLNRKLSCDHWPVVLSPRPCRLWSSWDRQTAFSTENED